LHAFGRFGKIELESVIFFENGDPIRFLAVLFEFAVSLLLFVFLPTFSLSVSARRARVSVAVVCQLLI